MAFVEIKLSGLDGVLKTLEQLPPEVVSKRGGPVRYALAKGARLIVNEEKKNLQSVTSNATKSGEHYSTGLLAKNVRMLRKNPPAGTKGEKFVVGLRRVVYSIGNRVRGRRISTTDTGYFLEYGTQKQPAEPWVRPAFAAKAAEAIRVIEQELLRGIDRVVAKLATQNKGEVMLPPVFQTLKASADVKNILGTNPPRIFRHGEAPQDIEKPYVTWFVAAGAPENNLSDPPPTDRRTVQIDCWHPTDAGVELLATAVRDAAELVTHMTAWRNPPRETETRMYRISMDFDFWGR